MQGIGSFLILAILAFSTQLLAIPLGDHHHHDHDVDDDPSGIHNGSFCVDLTHYGKPYEQKTDKICCSETLEKDCSEVEEQVCVEIPRMDCDIEGYRQCELTWENRTLDKIDYTPVNFTYQVCKPVEVNITHLKYRPECKNVTRHNCITKWVLDKDNGQPTFKPTKDCKEVTWEECDLVPYNATFPVPSYDCTPEYEEFETCTTAKVSEMIDVVKCEPKAGFKCKFTPETRCIDVKWTKCVHKKVKDCEPTPTVELKQDEIHQQICLQPESADNELFDGLVPDTTEDPEFIEVNAKMDCDTQKLIRKDGLMHPTELVDTKTGVKTKLLRDQLTTATLETNCPDEIDKATQKTVKSKHLDKKWKMSCEAAQKAGWLAFGAATISDEDRAKCNDILEIADPSVTDQVKENLPEVVIPTETQQAGRSGCKVDYDTAITFINNGDLTCPQA